MRRLQDFTVKFRPCCCTAAVRRAAVTCWNICRSIFHYALYYNPNIYPPTEYEHRVEEQQRLIHSLPAVHPISFCPGPYDSNRFYELTRGDGKCAGGRRALFCLL